ncbi:MAG TPA: 1,4-alpha-glucan branching protein GlgB [Bacteroidia bacterium]|nr:1,4-alpha-glucan branching protein GlgB [Bacteroidia bacterium]
MKKNLHVIASESLVSEFTLFTNDDIELFHAGKHCELYRLFGAHVVKNDGHTGMYFAVWAPSVMQVSVMGSFNGWDKNSHKLIKRTDHSNIWEGFVAGVIEGEMYKFVLTTPQGIEIEKADPFAFAAEHPPHTSSVTRDLKYKWSDAKWMKHREQKNSLQAPISVYEVHLESWRRKNDDTEPMTYSELAIELVSYVKQMGFTHVEFMPVMHYPYFGSWGYQITGYYCASPRFGSAQELMHLIEAFHKADIGVILDWVPSHFPGDAHGLYEFNGTHLYEHPDPQRGYQPDWKSYIFNYGLHEVRSFLLSNAVFWFDKFHIDGIRVDAVASMLHRDFSRNEGEWTPNVFGGNENLEAVSFIKELNEVIYKRFEGVQTIAEESTTWQGVTWPTYSGGLGFGMKWMMGWMNDTLSFFKRDPLYRKHHLSQLTFSMVYAFSENFMLPLSHDEMVHGKASLIYKMPGDEQQKFANLRTMYAYMYSHPGTKLLFMGGEFAQTTEWNYKESLHWELLQHSPHKGMSNLIQALNKLYTTEDALYALQFDASGFEWMVANDDINTVLVYVRKSDTQKIVVVLNLTPVACENYALSMPAKGSWKVILNTDDTQYGGADFCKTKSYKTSTKAADKKLNVIKITLPPLSALFLKQ